MRVEEMASSTAEAIRDCTGTYCGSDDFGETLLQLAKDIIDEGGNVPFSAEGLERIGVNEVVAKMLSQQVFGSTEVVIGHNTRKLVCALDLYDWEEHGAKHKQDIKISKIPANYVQRSIATWVAKGEGIAFQETMELLAEVIGSNRVGFWGQLKNVVNKHFSPMDKKKLLDMALNVIQFYKATRGRRGKK